MFSRHSIYAMGHTVQCVASYSYLLSNQYNFWPPANRKAIARLGKHQTLSSQSRPKLQTQCQTFGSTPHIGTWRTSACLATLFPWFGLLSGSRSRRLTTEASRVFSMSAGQPQNLLADERCLPLAVAYLKQGAFLANFAILTRALFSNDASISEPCQLMASSGTVLWHRMEMPSKCQPNAALESSHYSFTTTLCSTPQRDAEVFCGRATAA